MSDLTSILQEMNPISLTEMKQVQLMNRVDFKYIMTKENLYDLLESITPLYRIQTIDDEQISNYKTLYLETPHFDMYLAHHNKKLYRQKLRMRSYRKSNKSFCEIKTKINKGRTLKERISIPYDDFYNSFRLKDVKDFISENLIYDKSVLLPHIENQFNRITLVNNKLTERVTIDCNIGFYSHYTGETIELPELVILELKQNGLSESMVKENLMYLRIKSKNFSKYCMGTILTNHEIKSNRFKRKLRYIDKICHNN